MESNDSPEIPDRGETSDIPGLPSGVLPLNVLSAQLSVSDNLPAFCVDMTHAANSGLKRTKTITSYLHKSLSPGIIPTVAGHPGHHSSLVASVVSRVCVSHVSVLGSGSPRLGVGDGEDQAVRGSYVRLPSVVEGPVEDPVVTTPIQHVMRGSFHLRNDPHLVQ